jgi:hypothetical protein
MMTLINPIVKRNNLSVFMSRLLLEFVDRIIYAADAGETDPEHGNLIAAGKLLDYIATFDDGRLGDLSLASS